VLCCCYREAEATLEEHEKMLLQLKTLQEEAKVCFNRQTQQLNKQQTHTLTDAHAVASQHLHGKVSAWRKLLCFNRVYGQPVLVS
jgi:hypothetical protein